MSRRHLTTQVADVLLLSVESRSRGFFYPANLLLLGFIIAGSMVGVVVGHWPVAVGGLVAFPAALYWQGRSIARRLLRSGVLEDLRTTPHGQALILGNLDEVCGRLASRALYAHLAIFASVVVIHMHQMSLDLLPVLAALVALLLGGGGLYFGAVHAGRRDGLRIHTVGQQLTHSFESLLRSLAGASVLVVLFCGAWWIYMMVSILAR